jgi:hypothetical protein
MSSDFPLSKINRRHPEGRPAAAGIVTNLRGLLKKKDEVETQELDLNDIVTSTVEIVGPKR